MMFRFRCNGQSWWERDKETGPPVDFHIYDVCWFGHVLSVGVNSDYKIKQYIAYDAA